LLLSGPDKKDCPLSLGLKDGDFIAFAFEEERNDEDEIEFIVEWSSYDENYDMEEDEQEDDEQEEDEQEEEDDEEEEE